MMKKHEAQGLLLEGVLAEIEAEALRVKRVMIGEAINKFLNLEDYDMVDQLDLERGNIILASRQNRDRIKSVQDKMEQEMKKGMKEVEKKLKEDGIDIEKILDKVFGDMEAKVIKMYK